jgi:cell division septation protein DedD
VEGAVLTLDGGQRSELARNGAFRFDAVRSGDHRLELLKESLPEGSTIVGGTERSTPVTREQSQVGVTFLVTIEKRPEVRKVFPPKVGGGAPPPAKAASPAAKRATTVAPAQRPAESAGIYTIQVAALNNSLRARAIVEELKSAGFAAYLLKPSPTDPAGPYRVRVGRFATRLSAEQTAARLESQLGSKLWVTKAR